MSKAMKTAGKLFTIAMLVPLIWLSGCSTPARRMNEIQVGMTRADVLSVLGQPISKGVDGDSEILYYKLAENISDYSHSFWGGQPYYVKITDGKVAAYGRQGASQ